MTNQFTVDLDQIQGNVTPGFRKDNQDFLFLRFPTEALPPTSDLTEARAWLQALRPSIATAREVATFNALYLSLKRRITASGGKDSAERFLRSTWVNVAFTHVGHQLLLGGAAGGGQSVAFTTGMFNRRHETKDYVEELGPSTVRDSVTSYGATPEQEAQVAHVLLIIGADSPAEVEAEVKCQTKLAKAHGLTVIEQFQGESLGGGLEHFGFRDGLSQPDPVDLLDPNGWVADDQVVAPGEIIRGAPAEAGHSTRPVLPWETNGSYLVFRRLDQNVQSFRAEAVSAAGTLNGGGATCPVSPALFEAKCIGRWQDGTPLNRPLPDPNVPETEAEKAARLTLVASDFWTDPEGLKIPRFSHIRKGHPRDQPGANPKHHRIVRRGIPFGPPLPNPPLGAPTDTHDRGLLFCGYMASIEDQFEFLMKRWLHDPIFATGAGQGHPGPDPILGGFENYPLQPRTVSYARVQPGIGGMPAVLQHQALSIARFITFKGGGYFFSPSIAHIEDLAGA